MGHPQEAVHLTQSLLRFNTINPPGEEEACAQHIGRMLEAAGFKVVYHALGRGRASLVATIGGRQDKPPILFTGHLDVVPLGAAPWKHEPFAGEIDAGRVYGRGASDMKAGVGAFVAAVLALAPKLASTAGVTLVLTAGEETGCEGAFDLVKKAGAIPRAGAVVVAEPTGNFPFVGHRGAFWLHAKTHGVTAHGSMPDKGVNAVYKAAHAICALERFRFSTPAHPLMGQGTLNVASCHGGLNINSVPDAATVAVDIRTVPTQHHGHLRDELGQLLGPDVHLETLLDVAPVYTEPDEPWVQEVFDVMTPYLGARPDARTATFFTDAAALKPAAGNPPTLILGPGESALAHQTDEYCRLDRVEQCADAFVEITRRWCGL